jgi:hypothetical protein
MKQFVAMTDDVLYRGDGPPVPLVPYQCGVFCWHRLRDESQPSSVDQAPIAVANRAGDGAALSA